MILYLLSYLKDLASVTVVTEDLMLKCFSSTSILMIFMSILVTGKTYLNDPIHCYSNSQEKYPRDLIDTFCYIHGTYTVKSAADNEKLVGLKSPVDDDDKLHHLYYQWVNLVLFLQACSFYIPRIVWRNLEGKTIQHLTQNLNNPVLRKDERETQKNRVVAYLTISKVSHRIYGRNYLLVYLLTFTILILNIIATNIFLNFEFVNYAENVLHYGKPYQNYLFPKLSKCEFNKYGPSGTIVSLDILCLLPLNILNDKIYFVLSFWFLFLLSGVSLASLYWTLHWFSPGLRIFHMKQHLKGRVRGNRLNTVNKHFGDWFLLHLLMKNIDRRTFQEIVNELCDDREGESCKFKRTLTNISEDMENIRDEEEKDEETGQFFIPGNSQKRKVAVNFGEIVQ